LYNFTHHDRKDLSSLIGYIFYRKRIPGTIFLPSVKDCEIIGDEFAAANIPSIGVIDSNSLS
jgi:ribosomal protein S2